MCQSGEVQRRQHNATQHSTGDSSSDERKHTDRPAGSRESPRTSVLVPQIGSEGEKEKDSWTKAFQGVQNAAQASFHWRVLMCVLEQTGLRSIELCLDVSGASQMDCTYSLSFTTRSY